MLAHYSHVRLDAKRKALDALTSGGSGGSYGTKSGTNSPEQSVTQPQVLEKVGGREGARTPDLLVANEALSQLSYTPEERRAMIVNECLREGLSETCRVHLRGLSPTC